MIQADYLLVQSNKLLGERAIIQAEGFGCRPKPRSDMSTSKRAGSERYRKPTCKESGQHQLVSKECINSTEICLCRLPKQFLAPCSVLKTGCLAERKSYRDPEATGWCHSPGTQVQWHCGR